MSEINYMTYGITVMDRVYKIMDKQKPPLVIHERGPHAFLFGGDGRIRTAE